MPSLSRLTLLEHAADTPGAMTPLHVRAEPETFRILAGELTFFLGRTTVRAGAGDVVVAQPGLPRTLRVEAPGTRWVVETSVASAARFDDFGRALARPAAEPAWSAPEDKAVVAALAAPNGIRVLGPPGALPA